MIDAKHIAALEAWLNKTRDEQNQAVSRLRELEAEADKLRGHISALDEIAQQAESMIDNALVLMRDGMRGSSGSKGKTSFSLDRAPAKPAPIERPRQESSPSYPNSSRTNNAGASSGTVAYLNSARSAFRNNPVEPISNRFADRTITQACTLLLREAGVPLHVNDLYNLLVAGGMEFKGNNPTISVAVSLNRNRRFKKVGPGTFDLMIREAHQKQAAS